MDECLDKFKNELVCECMSEYFGEWSDGWKMDE